MTGHGLPDRTWAQILGVLAAHPEVEQAILFGSRAKGTHRVGSDVDLALVGAVDLTSECRIAGELDELPTPYTFDVVALASLRHAGLRAHIERVGVVVWDRGAVNVALPQDRSPSNH